MTAAGLDFMAARYLDAVRQLDTATLRADQAEARIAAALTVCDRWHDHDLPLAALRAALTAPHQLTPGEPT